MLVRSKRFEFLYAKVLNMIVFVGAGIKDQDRNVVAIPEIIEWIF